jgi:hypothetical protein
MAFNAESEVVVGEVQKLVTLTIKAIPVTYASTRDVTNRVR